MPNYISELVLPVLNDSTGETTNQSFTIKDPNAASEITIVKNSVTIGTTDTTVTFNDERILSTSTIDVYTDPKSIPHKSMNIANGVCTIVFMGQTSSTTVNVKICIK